MGYSDFGEIEVKEVLGLEHEKADREVGIMGDEFNLIVGDENDKPQHIYFNDSNFLELLEVLKPYYEEQKAREDYEEIKSSDIAKG